MLRISNLKKLAYGYIGYALFVQKKLKWECNEDIKTSKCRESDERVDNEECKSD